MLNYHIGDPFNNSDATNRWVYYGMSGTPTAVFDGTDWSVGGDPSNFNTYRTKFNQHIVVNTPGNLSLKVNYNPSPRTGTITVRFTSVDEIVESDLHLRYAIAESHKSYNWYSLHTLEFIMRKMLPDYNGVGFTIKPEETIENTQNFYIDPTWAANNCELVVFVQSDVAKKVLVSNLLPLYQTHVSGDANGDGMVTISDVVFLSNYLFYNGPEPYPSAAGDPNEDCLIDTQDMIYLIQYLFHGGPTPLRGWEID